MPIHAYLGFQDFRNFLHIFIQPEEMSAHVEGMNLLENSDEVEEMKSHF